MKTKNGLITYPDGTKVWYLNDQLHREDGPAVEHPSGHKEWWLNGQRHRENGPAVEYIDGSKAFWHDGKSYDKISYYNLMIELGHITKTQAFVELI